MSDSTTFCADALAREHLKRIRALVHSAGYEPAAGDVYLLGTFANAAARLEQLADSVSREKDDDRRLRLMAAERLARGDMARLIDQLERHYAGAAEVEQEEASEVRLTGTDNVVAFPRVRTTVGQRVVAVVTRTSGLTRAQVEKRTAGSRNAFLVGLREALAAGAIQKTGSGRKGDPFRYRKV